MLHFNEFDYVIVNEVFDTAVDELCAIFTASRLRREAQKVRHASLIRALLTPIRVQLTDSKRIGWGWLDFVQLLPVHSVPFPSFD